MKEFHYILFSIFLSSMIIYMGVGIPIVQSRCYQCADKDAALLTVVDISNYGCTCGCGDVGNKNVKSGSGCSCHHDKMMERKSSDVPCSSVKIQKINLPVLGTSLHLYNVTLSVIHLIFNAYSVNFDLLSSVKKESCYTDTSLCRQPPRGYLNLICTLLI